MPSRIDIGTFHDTPTPPGKSPWVPDTAPQVGVAVVDPTWSQSSARLAIQDPERVGLACSQPDHVGSTSVSGLAGKPIIDIDLTVADPNDESAYLPALEAVGFELGIRDPWWYGHRVLRSPEPPCRLHVLGYESPELVKHRIFRDWLRGNADEFQLDARTKREAPRQPMPAGSRSCSTTPARNG